jgi:hypothetical protein
MKNIHFLKAEAAMHGRESDMNERISALHRKVHDLQCLNDGLKGALSLGTTALKKQRAAGHWGAELEAALASADAALEAVNAKIREYGNVNVS